MKTSYCLCGMEYTKLLNGKIDIKPIHQGSWTKLELNPETLSAHIQGLTDWINDPSTSPVTIFDEEIKWVDGNRGTTSFACIIHSVSPHTDYWRVVCTINGVDCVAERAKLFDAIDAFEEHMRAILKDLSVLEGK